MKEKIKLILEVKKEITTEEKTIFEYEYEGKKFQITIEAEEIEVCDTVAKKLIKYVKELNKEKEEKEKEEREKKGVKYKMRNIKK